MANLLTSETESIKNRKKVINKKIIKAFSLPYTITYLRGKTPPNIIANSKNSRCSSYFRGKVVKPDGKVTYAWDVGCSSRTHIATIEIQPSEDPRDTPVNIQCSCEYYVYTLEVANYSVRISDNNIARNSWPRITNPSGSNHLCKHLYMVSQEAVNRAVRDVEDPYDGTEITGSKLKQAVIKAVTKSRRLARKRT